MFIRKCEEALIRTQQKTPRGAGNFRNGGEDDFARKIRQKQIETGYLVSKLVAMMPFAYPYYKDQQDPFKFESIIKALFAEILGCTNCGGAAALGAMELLQGGVDYSLEIIAINREKEGEHAFIVLNRKKEEELKADFVLSDIIYFDAWRKVNLTQAFEGGNKLTANKFLALTDTKSITTIETMLHIENNFTASDWLEISMFLKEATKHMEEMKKPLNEMGLQPKNVIKQFIEKAQFYSQLAQPAMLRTVGQGRATSSRLFCLFDKSYSKALPKEIREQKFELEDGTKLLPLETNDKERELRGMMLSLPGLR